MQRGIIRNNETEPIAAEQLASLFKSTFGDSGICSIADNLAASKINNNTVRLAPGEFNLSGYIVGVPAGSYEDITIDSGTAGQNRNDIIVAEFVRNGESIGNDTLHFTVVKGTSTSGTATDPALTQQDINAAGVTRQEALYRVKVVGTEITAVEKVAGSVSNLNLVDTTVESHLAEYANLLDVNGYQRIPGGLIEQWGSCFILANTGYAEITTPISFPNVMLNVQATPIYLSAEGTYQLSKFVNVQFISTNKIGIYVRNLDGTIPSLDLNCSWVAKGY